ncbi:hypothetical protein EB796_000640 [Bugula neritina]|uniref:Uncharacterized protein n=1 Tax=Bugula neritina TaxID=10212 RepID=A0A7J7KSA2_BUGNE|nr:hypothetical protein EB796_000640 [Bugula neritina]
MCDSLRHVKHSIYTAAVHVAYLTLVLMPYSTLLCFMLSSFVTTVHCLWFTSQLHFSADRVHIAQHPSDHLKRTQATKCLLHHFSNSATFQFSQSCCNLI